MAERKILAFQNLEFKILPDLKIFSDFKILSLQILEYSILAFQNPEFKILAHFKILAFQNLEFKIVADFTILLY